MPLTSKGTEIKSAMTKEYGPKKGESVFYASRNSGKIKGVDEDMSASPMQPSMTSSQPAMDCWAHMRKWHGKPAQDGGPGSGPHKGGGSFPKALKPNSENSTWVPHPKGGHVLASQSELGKTKWTNHPKGGQHLTLNKSAQDGGPGSGPHERNASGRQQKELMATSVGMPANTYTRTVKTKSGGDHGSDPLGNGMHRMVPSGDIVTTAEMMKRRGMSKDALPMARPAMAPKPMMAKPMMPKPAMAKPAMAHGPVKSIKHPNGTTVSFHNPMPKPPTGY